jgi:hypothetical protein
MIMDKLHIEYINQDNEGIKETIAQAMSEIARQEEQINILSKFSKSGFEDMKRMIKGNRELTRENEILRQAIKGMGYGTLQINQLLKTEATK